MIAKMWCIDNVQFFLEHPVYLLSFYMNMLYLIDLVHCKVFTVHVITLWKFCRLCRCPQWLLFMATKSATHLQLFFGTMHLLSR